MRAEATAGGLTIEVEGEAETERVGRALAGAAGPGTVIGLVGPLGAGKTRLSRAIAEAMGVDPGAIASPTYVLIHEYEGRLPVVHIDAYRLRDADEFEALGVDDYWGAGGVCLVEWADRVADRLPAGAWWIRIEPTGPERRRLVLELPGTSTGGDGGPVDRILRALTTRPEGPRLGTVIPGREQDQEAPPP